MVHHPTRSSAAHNLESAARLALAGIGINVVLSAVKITAGILGTSYALIADGVESLLDVGSSIILWGGLKYAAKPRDATHPYGHGKAEPFAAVLVSLAVIGAAGLLAAESVREIMIPHHGPKPFTLLVLLLVVVVKEILFRRIARFGEQTRSTAVQSDAWHHRSDAITSAFAFVGISTALIGGPGWESADDWAALAACGFISINGIRMFWPAFAELLDTAPPSEIEAQIRATAEAVPGVREIEKCYVRKMGLEYYVDLHARVDGGITVREGHQIAHQIKDAVRNSDAAVADVLVHIEPA